jgi:hypothetical protein
MHESAFSYAGAGFLARSEDPADIEWLESFFHPAFEPGAEPEGQTFTLKKNPEALNQARLLDSPDAERVAAFVLDTAVEELPGRRTTQGGLIACDAFFEVAYHRKQDIRICDAGPIGGVRRARGAWMRAIREAAMDHVWTHGASLLHASAFAIGDRAVLVAGDKEAGKTSLLCAALLQTDEAAFLSNDRVVLRREGKRHRVRPLPSIVSIRHGSARVVPWLRQALWGATENYLGAEVSATEEPERWILSPRQFSSLLGREMRREAELGCCLFPRIAPSETSFQLRLLVGEERSHRISECVFAKNHLGRRSELFRRDGEAAFPSARELRQRVLDDLRGVPCYELKMGPGLYQPEEMVRLTGRLPG